MTTSPATTLTPTTTLTTPAPPTTAAPTTTPPTTPAPTTTGATTLAPTTVLTTLAPTTAPPEPVGEITLAYPVIGIYGASPIEIEVEILGSLLNVVILAGPIEIEISPEGSFALGVAHVVSAIEIEITLAPADVIVGPRKCNWVKWSKIGHLDFTIDESNIAGERPLDWKGCIYDILKLDKSVVAYGENGVTILTPVDVKYSMQTIHRIGVLNKGAVAGTNFEHFFIDKTYKLYSISQEGLQLLDYSEFLINLVNPIMSLDPETGLLYICDGSHGYVYSTKYKSFGMGPINITGLGSQSGSLYVTARGDIETPKLHICTDIYDLGTRKPKTIHQIEVGTDLTSKLQAMVESRLSNKDGFLTSNWILVNPSGIAYIPCYGVEFRFHLRSYVYEYMEIDYLKVIGSVHGFSYLESIE